MRVGEVYPFRFLRPEDLDEGLTVVEIESAEVEEVRSFEKGRRDQKDPLIVLYLKGFEKGFKLNKTNARALMNLLKSDETRDWIGKQIQIFPDVITMKDGDTPTIKVSSKLPPKASVTVLGPNAAKRFTEAAKAAGGSYTEFLGWLKRTDRPTHDITIGVEIDQLPSTIAAFMKRYLDEIRKAPHTAGASTTHAKNQMGDPVLPPGDDDIPF